jgi:peptide/nickel transport system substrate-binding protein
MNREMQLSFHRTALQAAVLAVALLVVACGGESKKEAKSTTGAGAGAGAVAATPAKQAAAGPARQAPADTLVVAWSGDLNNMDPPFTSAEWNREFALNVYEPLVHYKVKERADGALVWEGLDVSPSIAESWTIDGPSVTFKLHKGVKFYPSGNELTADDVKYTFIRTLLVPGGIGKFNENLAGIFDAEKQVEVIDPYTVKITFTDSKGTPMLLAGASLPSMRFPMFGIVDSKVVKSKATADDPWAAAWMKENTAGTGPYYVEKRTPGTETVLRVVPGYWGKKPGFDRVILRVVKDSATVISLMKRGEVDITTAIGTTRELDALQEAGFTIYNAAIPNIMRMDIALEKPPLDKKEVRQAIAYAIPYDVILKNVFGGRGTRAYSYVNPQSPGYLDAFKTYTPDLNKAKDLLQKAGVGSGFQLDLYYDVGIPWNEDVALLIQDELRKLNITVTLKGELTTQFAADGLARSMGQPTFQGLKLSTGVIWLDDPDPNTDSSVKSTGSLGIPTSRNPSGYNNPMVDELHAKYRFSSDAAARKGAYEKIQQMVAEDVPLIPLVVTGRNAAIHPTITGFTFTADPHNRFWSLYLKKQ